MLPLQLFTMSRIVQLTTQIFSDEAAQQKAVEMIKKRDHYEMAVLFPDTHVEPLFAALSELPVPIKARSYAPGQGKLKAVEWAQELGAKVVEQWTLVDGVFTADPEKVATAEIIAQLNYREAQELASAGTGLLDREALALAEQLSVEIHIRSIYQAASGIGTVIDAEGGDKGMKAVSAVSDVALISITGVAFEGVAGIDATAFGALSSEGISVKLVSQASSERSLGLVVSQGDAQRAVASLEKAFEGVRGTAIKATEGLTILNIVGRHNYALERAIYELRRNNVWMHLIANSVEGHQISLVIRGANEKKALEVVHSALLGQYKRLNVFCFGKGLVGGTFIRQVLESAEHVKEKRHLDVRLIGVADSTKSLFSPEGLSEGWKDELKQSTASNDPVAIAQQLKDSGLTNLVVVDNTADEHLTSFYPEFVKVGCDLVASNKKGNAREQAFYDDPRKLLVRNGKTFKYETNVGAGLPLVDTLLQLHHSHDRITRIKGVFSGSMSFLFNTFSASDRNFTDVLNEAQSSGYTEPDPREDLNGMDVARKLLILARTVEVKAEISEVSIQNLIPEAFQNEQPYEDFKSCFPALDEHYAAIKSALKKDEVLRYVGDLEIDPSGKASLKVDLATVPKSSPLGGIQGSDSLFEIYTEGYGDHPMVIQGAGAGAEVTARGVFSDVLRLG
jgi:aspartokinase/homoserine dehydrogenase 1